LAALRERLDGFELRCAEEAREVFRHEIEESEARCMGAVEASVAAQFDSLRAELRAEVWPRSVRHNQDHFALDSVQHHLAQNEEERRVLSGQLETIADRQKRQQHLIEDLLSAAARRPSALGDVEDRISDQAASISGGLAARVAAVEDRLASIGVRRPSSEGGLGSFMCRSEVGGSSVAAAAVELAERCSGRLDLLSARVASVEDRVAGCAAPAAASVAEVQEALRSWPPKLEELAARLDSGSSELRREFAKELQAGLERWQAESGQQRAEVEDLRASLRKAQELNGKHHAEVEALVAQTAETLNSERILQGEEFATQVSKLSHAEQTAAVAESMAAVAVEQARGMRQLAEKAEQTYSKSVAALELDRAKSQARIDSDSREFAAMVRLEARLEGAEARQILAFTELSERLEEDLKRDAHRSNKRLAIDSCAEDVDLRRSPAFRNNGVANRSEEQAPWSKALRNLECHLKSLLAAQAEDSAEALRSMAQMVEEHSVLRGDVTSLRGDRTIMSHSGIMDNTTLHHHGDSVMVRHLGDR